MLTKTESTPLSTADQTIIFASPLKKKSFPLLPLEYSTDDKTVTQPKKGLYVLRVSVMKSVVILRRE
jgi:hypothetical protein